MKAWAVAAATWFCAAPLAAQTVAVEGGTLAGLTLASGVRTWLGVPFAAPPLRELRWRPPQPAAKWAGTFHADRAAPMCLQAGRGRTMNHYFGSEATSEDCLYLNIWPPPQQTGSAGEKLPVVVWIYGGGFTVGSASMANYSGEGLAEKGLVRVNLAYRVGPLGFFAHPELTREGGGHSGNYGLMDQVAGLEWVRRNIAAFGGDPGNVTIIGQSAGSISVSLLQIDQKAKGLFHKAVGMSGSTHGGQMGPVPLATGEAQGLMLQQALGVASLENMRDLAGDRILAAAQGQQRSPIVLDGAHITASAEATFAAGKHSDVPLLLGYTRDERFAELGPAGTVDEYREVVRRAFPVNFEHVLKAYPAKDDTAVGRALVDLMRDMSVGRQMFLWADAGWRHGKAGIWAYFFTRRQPYAPGIRFADHDPATVGAYHTGEVPYFLRTLDSLNLFRRTRDWSTEDLVLSDTMAGAIISFARTGVPVADWPAFDPARPRLMRLDIGGGASDWPSAKAMPLLAGGVSAPAATPPTRIRD